MLSLTTLSLRAVDSSKVVGGLPWEEMSEVFAQTWGQTFFEESRSRQTQQSFFHACSALPRSSYHNWATTTFHNHRKVTILYLLLFKETSLFDGRLVRASVRYFSRTLVAGRKLVGWGGVLRCWMGRGRIDSIAFPIIKPLPISSTTSPNSPS